MSTNYIIPKSDSPYAALDFPYGIPVTDSIPTGLSDNIYMVWELDTDRATQEQLQSFAKLCTDCPALDLVKIGDGVEEKQRFGILHQYVERLVGDDSSPDDLEFLGRHYRDRQYLMWAEDIFLVNITIDDAAIVYIESKYAIGSIGDGEDFPDVEIVERWLPVIVRQIEERSPKVAAILQRDEPTAADFALLTSAEYDTIGDIEVEVLIPAYTAYLLCAILQLRIRDPECETAKSIQHFLRIIESAIVQLCPEAGWVLARNWHI